MKRALLIIAIAVVSGIGTGEYLANNIFFRRWLGAVVRRDELLALVARRGIYQSDVDRAWHAELFAIGAEAADLSPTTANEQKRGVFVRLIAQEKLHAAASRQTVDSALIDHEANLLRWQFADEKSWRSILDRAATSWSGLHGEVTSNLRARAWIEERIAGQLAPNDEECRRYFETHREAFQEPLRFRASHLFLAAPDDYPEEVIATKRALINELATRLQHAESFTALVAEFSEDERTKGRGGDLNYFCAQRMLPAVTAAVQLLREGETSAPIRSRLGFHLVRLDEKLLPRQLTFEEALPEISAILENEKRANAVAALAMRMPGKLKIAGRRNRSQFHLATALTAAPVNGTL